MTSEALRAVLTLTRWADAALVQRATLNAAARLADHQAARLEQARVLQELNWLRPTHRHQHHAAESLDVAAR